MEQIASVEKLQQCLDAVRISDDYSELQDLITELHFACEQFRFGREVPLLSDERTLWDTAYYLLTVLTNPQRRSKIADRHAEDGLAISGLVFELLGRYAELRHDPDLRQECYLNAAIADTLSLYEANSAVLAREHFDRDLLPSNREGFLTRPAEYGMNVVLALLAREFFWIGRNALGLLRCLGPNADDEEPITDGNEGADETLFWELLVRAVVAFASFMVGGEEQACDSALERVAQARHIALEQEFLSEHWLASRLLDCYRRMADRSVWRVLRLQGFEEEYIASLARFPWNAVHELWDSQIAALTRLEVPDQPEQRNILSDDVKRVLVSMPTSAGKTLLAELAIVRALQTHPGAKCVYVAPSRALVDEIETKLHRRLRFLGHRVASAVGAFESAGIEYNYIESVDVLVLTPEKLDYLFRRRDPFVDEIALIVFDEVHKVSEGERGWFLETLVTWLLLKPTLQAVKMLFMTAVLARTSQPRVQLWIGQQGPAPILESDWSPTRRVVGVLWYERLKPDWARPLGWDKARNRCYWGVRANLTFQYGIGVSPRTVVDLYRLRWWFNSKPKLVRREEETRFDRCLYLIDLLGAQSSTLVYFQEKIDLVRFCRHAQAHLAPIQDERIDRLVRYIRQRLGADFPLVESLPYGVAFHHGDLPIDVKSEIEAAYRARVIPILACTTTLTEGVNFPIQTLILGYHQTWSGHRLSVRDFKNIMGRAGRALVETEGRIIAIRHPEIANNEEDRSYFDALLTLDEGMLAVGSEFPPYRDQDGYDRVIAELNRLVEAVSDAQRLAQVEFEELADELHRLQVFIFSLYEDGIITDPTPQAVERALQHTLLFVETPDESLRTAVSALSQRFASICSQMEQPRLRRYNTSGLRYRSNFLLEQLAQQIAQRCVELSSAQYSFEQVVSAADLQFILANISEARPQAREYRKDQYEVVRGLDHYGILLDWIKGEDFSAIREKHFRECGDTESRTETCQGYISKQLTFKLPWVLAALHTHIQQFANPDLDLWLQTAPAQVKYGVDTPEAVYFSSAGVRSRFLARRLGQLYRAEEGPMAEYDWKPLEDWFVAQSPFDLREKAPELPDLAIRQAIQRINSIRRPVRDLNIKRRLVFTLAGWQYYNGERLLEDLEQCLKERTPSLNLQHEPENEYDEYAVAVFMGEASPERKIGYVPRAFNEEVAVSLALGRRIEVRVVTIEHPRPSGWRPVQVRIDLVSG